MTPPPKAAAYKRSWKNLLINKRYQLRFTLFMVGLSTVLMVGLGTWVMKVANEATEVSKISVRGTPCPKVPDVVDAEETPLPPMNLDTPPASDAPPAAPPSEGSGGSPGPDERQRGPGKEPPQRGSDAPKAHADDGKGSADAPKADSAGSADDAKGDDRPRAKVQLDPSSITIMQPDPKTPTVPADYGKKVVAHWTCEMLLGGRLDDLERGRWMIFFVMVATGLLLVLFLAAYGLKMTHKVAGPLFKVGLYLGKMRNGRFDKVYNLRKGDQLVDFYEHFKGGHAGVVKMQKEDIAKLTALIAAAESAGAGAEPAVAQLREMLARKEKSIE